MPLSITIKPKNDKNATLSVVNNIPLWAFKLKQHSMKVITFALLLCITLTSCDSDAPEPSDEGLILGTWNPIVEDTYNLDGTLSKVSARPCSGLEKLIFNEDGTLYYRDFEENSEYECRQLTTQSADGTWLRLDNGSYLFTLTNLLTGDPLEIKPVNISFNRENSMQIQFDPVVDNGNDPPFIYVTGFIKAE